MIPKKLCRTGCLFIIALLFPCLAANGQASSQGPKVYQTTIQLSPSRLIFTRVKVDGKEVLALIDTGSSQAIKLSSRLAQELNLSLTVDSTRQVRGYDNQPFYVKKGHVKTIALGDFEAHDVLVGVAEGQIENIAKQIKADIEVILGWEFLSQNYFVLDYKQSLLRLSHGPINLGKCKMQINYAVVKYVPVIKGAFDKDEVSLLFDTGAPMCNIDSGYAQDAPGNKVVREIAIGENKFPLEWRVKDLSVIKNTLGCSGVIGNNFLDKFTVYFDTGNKVIQFY